MIARAGPLQLDTLRAGCEMAREEMLREYELIDRFCRSPEYSKLLPDALEQQTAHFVTRYLVDSALAFQEHGKDKFRRADLVRLDREDRGPAAGGAAPAGCRESRSGRFGPPTWLRLTKLTRHSRESILQGHAPGQRHRSSPANSCRRSVAISPIRRWPFSSFAQRHVASRALKAIWIFWSSFYRGDEFDSFLGLKFFSRTTWDGRSTSSRPTRSSPGCARPGRGARGSRCRLNLPATWSWRQSLEAELPGSDRRRKRAEAFVASERTMNAVIRDLGIIGEPAKRLPEEVISKAPSVPSRKVRGMRDIVAHGYFGVGARSGLNTAVPRRGCANSKRSAVAPRHAFRLDQLSTRRARHAFAHVRAADRARCAC